MINCLIVYCDWLCSLAFFIHVMIGTWYIYATLDTLWYAWPDRTSNSITDCPYCCSFIICMLFLSYSSIYFHHMFTQYMHVHLPLYSYTFIGSADSLDFAHPSPCIFYIVDQVFKEDHSLYEEPKFPYLVVSSRYIVTLLYSCRSFLISYTGLLFYSFIHML